MTPHFTVAGDPKLTCSCGCGLLPEQDFMDKAERVRMRCGFPLKVASAARCPAYNTLVSTTGLDGPHTKLRAIDFELCGAQALIVVDAMRAEGFSGIGISQKGPHDKRFVHGDDLPDAPGQPRPWIWSY